MTATRDFWWTVTPTRATEWTRKMLDAQLAHAQAYDDRLIEWELTGTALGKEVVQVRLRVIGRDRHYAGQLAQNVMRAALLRCKATAEPFSLPLTPHANRGYAAGRKKRYRTVLLRP